MPVITPAAAGGDNVVAFLDTLAWSEIGEKMLKDPASDNGYKLLVGSLPGKLLTFNDYSRHPNQLISLPKLGIKSSAAGRYQFLSSTWRQIVKVYGFKGRFIPEAQDLAAIKLLKECGALPLIQAGKISDAIRKAAPIWASLPGAGYGQREHELVSLLEIYASEKPTNVQTDGEELLAHYCDCGGALA
ncbi:muramidase (phage lysozyme) [Comamonas sp. BIGb0124]|uniref:glycoside hydrolase family 24 protein n=1 Tax=Comamonas sp. BIGb0124 TaxID=2485130 RepID=UPI000F465A3F|nr:glycoside hydrolase family 104 protein [Comamonas sp. BIGb0124]ROR25171.1 muramidase (phage lysozyme) [Comamonas sp. BIGb0124]